MSRRDPQSRSFSADRLGAALREVGGSARPEYLDNIVAQVQDTRQRPAWTFAERWLPVDITARPAGFPRAAVFLALFLLTLALVAATAFFAGTLRAPATPLDATNGLIAYVSGTDIVAVQPDGTGRHTLVEGAGSAGAGSVGSISFSPEGRRFAYWTFRGLAWDLVVVDSDGSDPVTIATGAVDPSEPSWSPDGSRVAYGASNKIFVAATDGSGSGARAIGDPALAARPPAWSPDGSTIAFGAATASEPTIFRLHLMDPDGTNPRRVSDVRGNDFAFIRVDWSHDSSKVAAQASDADNLAEWDIFVIEVADGSARDVGAHVGGDEMIPSWAPDRDALAWQHANIVLLEEGTDPVDLPMSGIPTWSPDGRLIAGWLEANRITVIDLDGVVRLTIEDATGAYAWQPLVSGG